jgi:hypothetical protein
MFNSQPAFVDMPAPLITTIFSLDRKSSSTVMELLDAIF